MHKIAPAPKTITIKPGNHLISSKPVNSLHEDLKIFVFIAQCFALMPLKGINGKLRDLKYDIRCPQFYYSFIIGLSLGCYFIFTVVYTYNYARNIFHYGKN